MSQVGVTPRLVKSIQELYRVFKPYESLRHPAGCPCCVSDDDKRLLFSKPLMELTPENLERFGRKALTTWGTVGDLKHFLPRLLELVAIHPPSPLEHEILFGKLRLGLWETWPAHERQAVQEFLNAAWRDCLAAEAGSVWVDELLCGLGNAVEDVHPHLRDWTRCKLSTGYGHFVEYLDGNTATLLKRRCLSNPFWSDAEPQMRQVVGWLASPLTVQTLEDIFMENPDADFSKALATAVDRLASLQHILTMN